MVNSARQSIADIFTAVHRGLQNMNRVRLNTHMHTHDTHDTHRTHQRTTLRWCGSGDGGALHLEGVVPRPGGMPDLSPANCTGAAEARGTAALLGALAVCPTLLLLYGLQY